MPRRFHLRSPISPVAVALGLLLLTGPVGGSIARAEVDPTFDVWKTDRKVVSGRLQRLTPDALVLSTEQSGEIEIPTASIFKLLQKRSSAEPPPTPEGARILLPDGDRIHRCTVGKATETNLAVEAGALGQLDFPLDGLLGILLHPPESQTNLTSILERIRNESRNSEVLWLANGDRIAGGYLGLSDKTVEFQGAGGKLTIDRPGVVALGFDPALVRYPRPEGVYLELGLSDGTRIGLADYRLEKGKLLGQSRAGIDLKVRVQDIESIHVRGGSVVFLSDREPTQVQYVRYLGPVRPFRRDVSVTGQPLRLGGRTYDHGLGTHSRTLLAYKLEPGIKRFQAEVGLDETAGSYGQAIVRVLVDGKARYTSPPLTAKSAPQPIDLDLQGARFLILDTEFGERGEVQDLADWVEARLIR